MLDSIVGMILFESLNDALFPPCYISLWKLERRHDYRKPSGDFRNTTTDPPATFSI